MYSIFSACTPVNKLGVFCEFDCSSYCADCTCSREDGSCSSCLPQKFGRICDSDCPHCGTDTCHQSFGICVNKCDPGWYQLTCSTECKHPGCFECDRTNGEYISCKIVKYGTNCSLDCAATCGANSNGINTCNRFSGECDTKVCQVGYFTAQCTERCSQYCSGGSCDIDAGTCSPCLNGMLTKLFYQKTLWSFRVENLSWINLLKWWLSKYWKWQMFVVKCLRKTAPLFIKRKYR
jgi:hypothetical protein